VSVCQYLLSHPLSEARLLGEKVRGELELAAPRMLRHARPLPSLEKGLAAEFAAARATATLAAPCLDEDAPTFDHPPTPFLEAMPPADAANGFQFADALAFHDNRYAFVGDALRRTAVRFGWQAVAFAEIRDLNRHRTGTKHCPLVPVGFYHAVDQLPSESPVAREREQAYRILGEIGRDASAHARARLADGDPAYVYGTLLGTQFPFEHTTMADKFIYEAELRTGTGAHFRYAEHLRDALSLWYERYPETRALVLEGSAEPE
jgi:hypothetical protein